MDISTVKGQSIALSSRFIRHTKIDEVTFIFYMWGVSYLKIADNAVAFYTQILHVLHLISYFVIFN